MNEHAKAHLKKWGVNLFQFLVILVSVGLLGYFYVFGVHEVDGISMEPTFEAHDVLLADKFFYSREGGVLHKGDIVVFAAPSQAPCVQGNECDYVKRILGTGGDVISPLDGFLAVNGSIRNIPYEGGIVQVPVGHLFVVGDNYLNSNDSRDWGVISEESVRGKVVAKILPFPVERY